MRKVLFTLINILTITFVFAQSATYQYNRGSYLAASGSFAEALPYYNEALKLDTTMEAAWFSRGEAKYRLTDYNGAIDDFNKALSMNPKDENTYFFRAACNAKLMNLSAAIMDYTQAIAINPEFAQAFLNRGNARYKLNDKNGACEDWSKASDLGYPNANNENYCKVYTASK